MPRRSRSTSGRWSSASTSWGQSIPQHRSYGRTTPRSYKTSHHGTSSTKARFTMGRSKEAGFAPMRCAGATSGRAAEGKLGLAPTPDVLVHAALLVLLLREPDKMQPVGAPGWDDFFSVNHQDRPWRCLSIVLDRFQHR